MSEAVYSMAAAPIAPPMTAMPTKAPVGLAAAAVGIRVDEPVGLVV